MNSNALKQVIDTTSSMYAIEDLKVVPSEMSGKEIVEHLDNRIADVLKEIESSDLWKFVMDPNTPAEATVAIMKEIYLEIVMYQPDVIEATIATVAQMPRNLDVPLFDEMLHHQVEEFDHGEMALKDYVSCLLYTSPSPRD